MHKLLAVFKNDVFGFDPTSNIWAQLSPVGTIPSGRERMGFASSHDGLIYLFGGLNQQGNRQFVEK
jgi:hypothetical protein